MKPARITDAAVREALALATDPDICAVQREEEHRMELEEIDRLIEEVDREVAAEANAAASRARRPFADVERARRSQRRAVRDALSLLHTNALIAGMSGGGKAAGVRTLLTARQEGEAA